MIAPYIMTAPLYDFRHRNLIMKILLVLVATIKMACSANVEDDSKKFRNFVLNIETTMQQLNDATNLNQACKTSLDEHQAQIENLTNYVAVQNTELALQKTELDQIKGNLIIIVYVVVQFLPEVYNHLPLNESFEGLRSVMLCEKNNTYNQFGIKIISAQVGVFYCLYMIDKNG